MFLFKSLLNLLFPQTCVACSRQLYRSETVLCLFCQQQLPKTDHHLQPTDNPLARKFWGHIDLKYVGAYYFFRKQSRVQHLIHALKYYHRPDIGVFVGREYGRTLAEAHLPEPFDYILPIPLHPTKKAKRGYNQSATFAEGLSDSLQIPWSDDLLVRRIFTESQTRKSRLERWENVANVFAVRQPELLADKHLLLVDDVITTGSTIEACAVSLAQQLPNVRVSVAAMAWAQD